MQKLRLPFKESTMVCGYKTMIYLKEHGFNHFGIDISTIQGHNCSDHTVYASGEGRVVYAGWDTKLGGAVCIRYDNVYNHKTGRVLNVIARYMHMKEVKVKTGDKVKLDTPVGVEGDEGTTGYHLHLEFDSVLSTPKSTPQVSSGLSFWVHTNKDTTINPSFLLHQDSKHTLLPDNWVDGWLNYEDKNIPLTKDTPDSPPVETPDTDTPEVPGVTNPDNNKEEVVKSNKISLDALALKLKLSGITEIRLGGNNQ